MKNLFTSIILLLLFSMVTPFTTYAQNLWGLEKYSFHQPYLEQVVKHMDNPNLRAAGFPQKTHGYIWESSDWVIDSYMETVYYPNGAAHIETNFDPSTLVPIQRSTYTYDQAGHLTEIFTESYETGSWENALKMTMTYDTHGNLYEMTASYWTGAAWMVVFGSRSTYGYTPQNYVSSILFQMYDFMSGWQNYMNDIYTLAGNGYPTQVLTQKYDGGWVDSSRYVNIDWYQYIPQTGNGSFEYYEEELWSGGQWNLNLNESTVYDPNGGWVMTEQVYNGGWVNSLRETMIIENQLPVNYKNEQWEGGVWVQTDGTMYLYTFTGDNLTQEIIQDYNPGSLVYENSNKINYSDFFYTTGQDELINESVFHLYPNPANDEINILLKDKGSSNWLMEIMNLTGQVVLSETLDMSASRLATVPIRSLPEGLYVLRLTTADNVFTRTFIKR